MRRKRSHLIGTVSVGALVVAASFAATLWTVDRLMAPPATRPIVLADPPPLPAMRRTSRVVAPVAVALTAIRDAAERAAPHQLAGSRDGPLNDLLSKADIGWTVTRGPLAVAGRPDGLVVSTAFTGTLRASGQVSDRAGNLAGRLSSLVDGNLGRGVGQIAGRTFDQRADLNGTVTMTARPTLLPNWRLEPNLAAQVTMGDGALSIAGVRLRVASEVKPLLDRRVAEQIVALQTRLRTDPFIEAAARREWAKMCRSIPLKGVGKDVAPLWLELRPVRAFAAQPRIGADAVVLTLGVEAETQVVSAENKPSCPFPAEIGIVPAIDEGRLAIAVPIEMPLAELGRLMAAHLAGREFPVDGSGPFVATVRSARLAASGDRLLVSLDVKARERASLFGLGAEATVHVWGRPVLDREHQSLRLTDVAVDVESQAAFGLLGAAARAALPYLQGALEQNATVDLVPFLAEARASIEAALAEFRNARPGVVVTAAITDLRLADLAFDARALRVIAEADGTARVEVSALAP